MALEVVWSAAAENDRKYILAYWARTNGTMAYSRRLYSSFEAAIRLIQDNPYIGRPTDVEDVRAMTSLPK